MAVSVDGTKSSRVLINLGCGPFAKRSPWLDYDGSWNVLVSRLPIGIGWLARKILGHKRRGFPDHVRYLNLSKPLPFGDSSVDAIYFSHVLEHLYLEEGRRLLSECHRVLRRGGIIRVLVPDTEYFISEYQKMSAQGIPDACFQLNDRLGYRLMASHGNFLHQLYAAATDFHTHKFMYDRSYLARCLAEVGFVGIAEAQQGSYRLPEFGEVEIENRIGGGNGFGFEAERP
jgi:SAM-dependent methyltransferase